MSALFDFTPGTTPLLVSCPHAGTELPETIGARLAETALPLPDTDWHVDRLYDAARELGAGLLVARVSRYVVDLNRDPAGTPLYPGAENTELCPLRTFDGEPVYRDGERPGAAEVQDRIATYWQPYHDRLRSALDELRERHGVAVLIDGHSIRSRVPRLFEGRLPDLNFGTARGKSADAGLAAAVYEVLAGGPFSSVRDGRFTGGYITRTYGRPAERVHAMQLEKAQATYMLEKPPYRYRPDLAARLKPLLRAMMETALQWAAARA